MHPWGLSGPEFLWLYTAGLVVGLAVAIGVRMAVRRPRLSEPPDPPVPEELGFLAGGPQHAVQVGVARLVDGGDVRVDRRGPHAYPDKELSKALTDGAAVAFAGGTWSYATAGSFDSFVRIGSSGGSTYTHNYTSSSSGSSSGGGCGGGTP